MTRRPIDLNADLGEGSGADEALLEVVTSASVACGFHAGDEETMLAACRGAVEGGVVIGAHVGYSDRAGFGRRPLDVEPQELAEQTAEQIAALAQAAGACAAEVRYLKPHGSLYHRCAHDRQAAQAVVRAAAAAGLRAILGPPGSVLLDEAAKAGLLSVAEGFADRRYSSAERLVGRDSPGAMLGSSDAIEQALALALAGRVQTGDGAEARVAARSICVHGDSPSAVAVARGIRAALEQAGVELSPFA